MIPGADAVLLRLRATDAGFDRELPPLADWLAFGAAGNQATLWLAPGPYAGTFVAAAAPHAVVAEVAPLAGVVPHAGPLPPGAAGAWLCTGEEALDALCRRLAVLGDVLPSQPLHRYAAQVARALPPQVHGAPPPAYPGSPFTGPHAAGATSLGTPPVGPTEYEAFVRQRIGQDCFREALMGYWGGRCPISGVSHPRLLRASHAKPWKDATDAERLDVHNGLLLAAHLDAAFDAGLITVRPDGRVEASPVLSPAERAVLGVGEGTGAKVVQVTAGHAPYLEWHGAHVFLNADRHAAR